MTRTRQMRVWAIRGGRPSSFPAGATLVIPGSPDDSCLIRKLEGREQRGTNADERPAVPAEEPITVIRRWIEHGAPNN
jgi:hypothetical protein